MLKHYLLHAVGTQICRSFEEHDLITCESKAQVDAGFLGRQ